jgi:uncharacterized membrane protein YeaQ/YmgE (transglycosylase-associated protein family)
MSIFVIHMVILAATGIVAGWLAGLVTRGSGFGLIGNMLAATAGAFALFYIGSDLAYYLGGFGVILLGLWGGFLALWIVGRIRR